MVIMFKWFCFLFLNPFTAMGDLIDFTLSNARRFYSAKGENLAVKGYGTLADLVKAIDCFGKLAVTVALPLAIQF